MNLWQIMNEFCSRQVPSQMEQGFSLPNYKLNINVTGMFNIFKWCTGLICYEISFLTGSLLYLIFLHQLFIAKLEQGRPSVFYINLISITFLCSLISSVCSPSCLWL